MKLSSTLLLASLLTITMLNPIAAADEAAANKPHETGFETASPGEFKALPSELGTWKTESGRAVVDGGHAKSGTRCLQLAGGERTQVTLELAENVDTSGQLTFWAERWTSRNPFTFRIEKQTEDGWSEIHDGDSTVRVGRSFLNHVKVPLNDATIEKLRFTVSSPPNTGILIDDVRIAPLRPQKILRVELLPFTLPALVGAPASPLAKLKITTEGTLNPIKLNGITATLDCSQSLTPLESVVASDRASGSPSSTKMTDASTWKTDETRTIQTSLEMKEGENTVWLRGRLKSGLSIDQRIGASIAKLDFSSGEYRIKASMPMQRMGVAVRNAGDDGVHTYRIPGLATTNEGTLIGVYDVRRRSGRDLPGDIDVGMSRSIDGGQTWEPMKVIMDMGNDASWQHDGIGDPAILVDRNTGTIWVAATWSHGNRSWNGSGPGLEPDQTGQLMLVRSDNDGVSWSAPINITKQVKKPEWCFLLQGPGKGITMHDGTLVFAAQYQDPPNSNKAAHRLPHSTILYSKDHGETWKVGTGAFADTTESQVVEIAPGRLMLNCRYNRASTRVVMITDDIGETWREHETSESALIEPRACMASLIDVPGETSDDDNGWLLFSNPNSTRGRNHITIKASFNRGITWPIQHWLLLDEHNSAGYSCMTMIDDKTVGILYEGSQAQMTFQRIPLEDILAGDKAAKKISESSDFDER